MKKMGNFGKFVQLGMNELVRIKYNGKPGSYSSDELVDDFKWATGDLYIEVKEDHLVLSKKYFNHNTVLCVDKYILKNTDPEDKNRHRSGTYKVVDQLPTEELF